jgi:hypothetical protein
MPGYSTSHHIHGDKGYWTQWRRSEEACKDDELSEIYKMMSRAWVLMMPVWSSKWHVDAPLPSTRTWKVILEPLWLLVLVPSLLHLYKTES